MSDRETKSGLSRREVLATAGVAALVGLGAGPSPARATAADARAVLDELIGGRKPQQGRVVIELPEIAENGNTVPLAVSVEGDMTASDYVKSIHVVAEGNPRPNVASFHFTARSGKARVATRMRLLKTQNVIAVAEMSDGSVYEASRQVKVTIGGCGG